ncbi:MAG: polymerase subunit epsilon [Actinomycetota bacterium]|jgi:DNA polymerase-3 subunit epsilon|nr:polymerase subunit epsilon [Actinomycetota bacterium]
MDWTAAEFASLDFELTGLDLANDHVVSFGVVPVRDGRIVLGESVHQLVEPPISPSPSSVAIHGMRAQDLTGAPPLSDAATVLGDALANRFLLVWFASVELAMLRRIYGRGGRGFARRCVDVRSLARIVGGAEGATPDESLSVCAERYQVPVAAPHNALDDALVTAQLFLVLAPRLRDQGITTVGDLLQAGR